MINIFQSSVVASKNADVLLISKADIIVDFVHFANTLHLSLQLKFSHKYHPCWEYNWNSFGEKATRYR